MPGTGFAAELLAVWNAPRQALPGHDADLDSGEVQPAAVLRRVVDFPALRDPPGLGRFERLMERCKGMDVQVVHHQNDFLAGKDIVHQFADQMRPVVPGSAVGTFTHRQPSNGANTMNRLATPLRSYSKSTTAG